MNSKSVWLVVLATAIILPFVTLPALASWEVPLSITSAIRSVELTFAFDENSTDGYDAGLDKPSPPFIGAFDAFFQIPGDKLIKDTRPSGSWHLSVLNTTGAGFTISWDVSSVPSSVELFLDSVDMGEQSSQTFPAGGHDITIVATRTVTVVSSLASLVANGISTADITVTVRDVNGNLVSGETITFELNPDIGTITAPVEDDGTYSATYTSGTTAGVVTITATTSDGKSNSINITLISGPAETVTVASNAASLVANGISTAYITVTVRDVNGNPVLGETITFELNPDIGTITTPVDKDDGTYSATYTSGTTASDVTITATTSNGKSGSVNITLTSECNPGDVSGDSTVSAYDAALILQYVVGLIDSFPVESKISPHTIRPQSRVISIPDVYCRAGKMVTVPVIINDSSGFIAGGIKLKYNPSILKAVDVLPTKRLSGTYWKTNTDLKGEVRFAFAAVEPIVGQGNLFEIRFMVLPNVEGESPLILDVNFGDKVNTIKIDGSLTILPEKTRLLQNYPNPFNPETWLPYQLANDATVTIHIYNIKGELVRTINLGAKNAGVYTSKNKAAYWNGRTQTGEGAASGVYYYTIQTSNFAATRKMILVK